MKPSGSLRNGARTNSQLEYSTFRLRSRELMIWKETPYLDSDGFRTNDNLIGPDSW